MAPKKPTRDGEAIIRQSQLERAIELFNLFQPEPKPTLREVLRLSQVLTEFQYSWELNNLELLKFEKWFKQEPKGGVLDAVPHVQTQMADENKKEKTVSQYQTSIAKQLKGKV